MYDVTAAGHSAKVGEAMDGKPIHGKCRSTRVRSTGGVAPRVSLYHETLHGEVADFVLNTDVRLNIDGLMTFHRQVGEHRG